MNFNLLAKLSAVDKVAGTEQAAVVVTGLAVVFSVLIILVLFVLAFGKLLNKPKNNNAGSGNAAAVKPQPVEKKNNPIASVSGGAAVASADDDEVIAVISAVIAQMSAEDGKTYKIKSVRPRQNMSCGRSAWAAEGLRQNTCPF